MRRLNPERGFELEVEKPYALLLQFPGPVVVYFDSVTWSDPKTIFIPEPGAH